MSRNSVTFVRLNSEIECRHYYFVDSYKEESDDVTDSEDLIEINEPEDAEQDLKDAAETIEKVIRKRIGHKGG